MRSLVLALIVIVIALSSGLLAAGLALDFLDCDDDTGPVDPCFADPETCGLSCGTCPICLEPSPVPGVDVVLQYSVLPDRFLPIYVLNAVEFSGFQGDVVCTDAVSGAPTTVDALAAVNYGVSSESPNNFVASTGIEGKFVSFDLGGGVIPAGYDLFLVLRLDEDDLLACAPDSVALSSVIVPNQVGAMERGRGGEDMIEEEEVFMCVCVCLVPAARSRAVRLRYHRATLPCSSRDGQRRLRSALYGIPVWTGAWI